MPVKVRSSGTLIERASLYKRDKFFDTKRKWWWRKEYETPGQESARRELARQLARELLRELDE